MIGNEKGLVLVTALLIMGLLSALGAGTLLSGHLDLRISSNLKSRTQAFYIAEAGLHHGWQVMADGDGRNDFATVFSSTGTITLFSHTSFGGGSYTVTAQAVSGSSPNRVKLTSTGCLPGGNPCPSGNSKVVIEAQFKKESGKPNKAVETDGDLKINGNPNIVGIRGGAHSNAKMQVLGNPGIQMADGLTASNNLAGGGSLPDGMDISGTPCVGGSACSNPPESQPETNKLNTAEKRDNYEAAHHSANKEALSPINPADYAAWVVALGSSGRGYILHGDGTVTSGPGVACGTDGLCTGGTAVAVPAGWSFSDGTWKVSGSSAAHGVFYSEGKVEISGSPGSPMSPWPATIISRDSIKVSGSPDIKPYPTASDDLKNHLLVTGNDLEISGNMEAAYVGGVILVHQQFKISGNPKINGFIIAGDGRLTWSGDPFPPSVSSSGIAMNEISGNPTITYNADFDCLGPGCPPPTVLMVSWREVF